MRLCPRCQKHEPWMSTVMLSGSESAASSLIGPRLFPFFPALSHSSIVFTAFHHGARRAFFMLFLASQFSHIFPGREIMKEETQKHMMEWFWHWQKHAGDVIIVFRVYWFSLIYLPVSQVLYDFVCFSGNLLYMFYRSLSCQIKCKPKTALVFFTLFQDEKSNGAVC